MNVPGILAEIVARKQIELKVLRPQRAEFERRAADQKGRQRGFASSLRIRAVISPAVIAEIKQASPSRGLLTADFRPTRMARSYELGGAVALSVLTDQDFFKGSLDDMVSVRGAVGIPILRKDFTIEELNILEAAAWGADAILLIAALHDAAALRRLREFALSLGVDALVEVHDEEELARTLESGATIVGVNNRDLRTFEVSLDTSLRLASLMPPTVFKVSESGIFTAEHIAMLRQVGYQAFLVGESLMKAPDPTNAVRALTA